MSDIKVPTTGRMVHYFPLGNDPELGFNHPIKMAAIVSDGVDTAPDLVVFTRWDERPAVVKLSIQHKSNAFNHLNEQICAYWDWPEII